MQSNDIDIALTDMMGDDFAGHLDAFAKRKNVETGPIAIFNPNPEQSKHLQTARIPIFGLELDLVNLRSEEYANNSRIPTAVVRRLVLCRLSASAQTRPGFRDAPARCVAERQYYQCTLLQRPYARGRRLDGKGIHLPHSLTTASLRS